MVGQSVMFATRDQMISSNTNYQVYQIAHSSFLKGLQKKKKMEIKPFLAPQLAKEGHWYNSTQWGKSQ